MRNALLAIGCWVLATVAYGQRQLHDGWRFRQGNSEIWHPAQVPGNTHLDLMRERIIDDPFFRLNERSVQWVDKEDWMYETHFTPTAEELAATNQTLVFMGLDTYADVYLNHQRILVADNMHRTWRCDVRGIMKEGDNLLEAYFNSPVKINIPKFDALPYRHNTGPDHSQMGGLFDKTISPFARTAGYEYGWDWGPRLVTFGIWRPVVLETWSGTRLADVWYIQKDVNKSRAQLQTVVEIEADAPVASATVNITADGKQAATKTVSLVKGLNTVAIDYTLRNPHLWWTNGLGTPYLTQMETALTVGPTATDRVTTPLGIRSLKLHNEKDPIPVSQHPTPRSAQRDACGTKMSKNTHKPGHCLYFELNGEPLYAKGSNMVPNDNFLTRCNDSVYHRVVSDAAAVNMNIIRVWGGGIYEDDAFYRYCDEMGILVWQDFMFACQTYEVDSAFLATVKAEAIDNVRRLRNHACMAVYTGNNEEQDVWFGWGGKKRYFEERGQAERVWAMQRSIFYEVLPDVVRQYGGGTAYRPSSPWAFDDTPSDGINGDDHYWGVWHGGEPFEAYFDHHVRFQSEYGFQSFPEYESVLRYNPDPRDHNIYSEVMMAHQNAGTYANHRIEEYMGRDYHVPADFQQFLYVGQVLQADGVKMGMEAFRRDRPYCMGGIIWQLNDCWPVASWSSRDYYGRWKALHYVTRKAYDDILVSPRVKDENAQARQHVQVAALPGQEDVGVKQSEDIALSRKVLELKLVNDRRSSVRGTLTLQTLTLDGRVVCQKQQPLTLPKNDAIDVYTLPVADLLGGEQPENVIFYITYETAGKTYYNIAYPLRQKQMAYRKPHLNVTLTPVADGFSVTVGTDVFARAVFLKTNGISDFFSDNYFDLLPGQSRTLHLRTNKPLEQIQKELETITLADTYPATRIDDLISRLTIEEKANLLMHYSPAVDRLGLHQFQWWGEALHGVGFSGFATVFPEPIGMAASFDDTLLYQVFDAVSTEQRAKYNKAAQRGSFDTFESVSVWTPNVNIFRDPRWGRGQETYGEDPYLTSRMGQAVVRGLQGPKGSFFKTLACAKHYAVHSGPEWNRHHENIDYLPPRDLWETYLPAFKDLVMKAGVQEVMCAYNAYDGEPCCSSNRLLQQILRDEWGFRGLVVSDCDAINDIWVEGNHGIEPDVAHASARGVAGGTDLNCGGSYTSLPDAVSQGLISEQRVDESLRRVMRARFSLGDFDPDSVAEWNALTMDVVNCEKHRELALRMARETITLLKNDGVLPLESSDPLLEGICNPLLEGICNPRHPRFVVLGPNANDSTMLWGNYSGRPAHTVTILEGIQEKVGKENVTFIDGCGYASKNVRTENRFDCLGQLKAEVWNTPAANGQQPTANSQHRTFTEPLNFNLNEDGFFAPGMGRENFSARLKGTFHAQATEELQFAIAGDDGFRLIIDGDTVVNEWQTQSTKYCYPMVSVVKGRDYEVQIDYFQGGGSAELKFDINHYRELSDDELLEQIPQDAETIIFVGGISSRLEGEEMSVNEPGFRGGDRESIELPRKQRDMLRRLKEMGKRIVFVNCSGSAMAMVPEQATCDAIVQAWYGGEQGGRAVADVLFGDYNPCGKLPITFYRSTEQLPDFQDYRMANRTYRYFKGEVLYPFGYGLSYTTFNIGKAKLEGEQLMVPVKNTGKREGTEVVQLYVRSHDDEGGPLRSLKGFTRITLKPGEQGVATIPIPRETFERWDAETNTMRIVPGRYTLYYGTSSAEKDLKALSYLLP